MKNLISRILIAATLIGVLGSCASVRIPKNPNKAKRTVEQNVRQIEAIVEYHGLRNPFTSIDTVVLRIPEKSRGFYIPSRLATDLDFLISDYIFPAIPDTAEAIVIKEKINTVIENNQLDYVYLDSLIKIQIKGDADGVHVEYTIFQQELKKVIESERYNIDTRIRWWEDTYFRIALVLILVILLVLIIRREGGPPRPPSLFNLN